MESHQSVTGLACLRPYPALKQIIAGNQHLAHVNLLLTCYTLITKVSRDHLGLRKTFFFFVSTQESLIQS